MRQTAISYDYGSTSDPLEKALFILQDAIVLINREGIISYINKAGQQIFEGQLGFQPGIGDNFLSLVTDEKKEITRHYIDRAFSNQSSILEVSYPQAGKECWFELGYYPIPEENGMITHVC